MREEMKNADEIYVETLNGIHIQEELNIYGTILLRCSSYSRGIQCEGEESTELFQNRTQRRSL
jgi:hypothetical protein